MSSEAILVRCHRSRRFWDPETWHPRDVIKHLMDEAETSTNWGRIQVLRPGEPKLGLDTIPGSARHGVYVYYTESTNERCLLFHWPDIVQNIKTFFEERLVAVPLFLQLFHEVLRRASPLAFEFLRRKQEQCFLEIPDFEDRYLPGPDKPIFMDTEESNYFYELFSGLGRMDIAGRSPGYFTWLTKSFNTTYLPLLERSGASKGIAETLGWHPEHTSLIEFPDVEKVRRHQLATLRTRLRLPEAHETSLLIGGVTDPLLWELAVLWHAPTSYGRVRVKNQDREDSLLVDLEMFHAKRRALNPRCYSQKEDSFSRFRDKLIAKYARLTRPLSPDRMSVLIGYLIGEDPTRAPMYRKFNVDSCLVFDYKKFTTYLFKTYNLGLARAASVAARGALNAAKDLPPSKRKGHVLWTPVLPEHDHKKWKVYLHARRHGRYYKLPPEWGFDPLCFMDGRDGDFGKGIFRDPEDGQFVATPARWLSVKGSPVTACPVLSLWMKETSELSIDALHKYQKRQAFENVDRDQRKTVFSTKGLRYTAEEDEAILRLYRPKMPTAAKLELANVCLGRTWTAIKLRARDLCSKMIQKGIYDLDRLPHVKYNTALGKEIAEARKRRTNVLH